MATQSFNEVLIRECLKELSDRTQQELWLVRSPTVVVSFTEAVEGLFSDSGLGDIVERHPEILNPQALELLERIRAASQKISDPPDLDTSEMIGLRSAARQLLDIPLTRESR